MIYTSPPPTKSPIIILEDNAAEVSHTGDTNLTVLKTLTVPGGKIGANGTLKVLATGQAEDAGGDKAFRLRFGGVTICLCQISAGAGSKKWHLEALFHNNNSESAQEWSVMWFAVSSLYWLMSDFQTTEDTGGDIVLDITGQLSNAADNMLARHFRVEIIPGL